MTVSYAPHGTSRRYDHGTRTTPPCRCTPCRKAKNVRRERQKLQRASGRRATIDAGPAREHVEKLHRQYGLGAKRIALLAGLSPAPVESLLGISGRPMSRGIRPATAAKLLAVVPTLDDLAGHTLVNSCGSRRRVQALVAAGRPLVDIVEETGLTPLTIKGVAHGERPTVRAATARAIRDTTTRLAMQLPPQRTTAQRRRAAAARRLAARHGWLPLGVWADIDDPAAVPEVDRPAELPADRDADSHIIDGVIAERVTWAQLRPADRRLLVRWGVRNGWSRGEIAERAKAVPEALDYYMGEIKESA